MQGVAVQGEGGDQAEVIGEMGQGLRVAVQLQHQGIGGLLYQVVFHQPGKAVLGGFIILPLGVDGTLHHLAGVGEQDGRMVAPDGLVRLPHVLHAVALAHDALHLGTPGGHSDPQVLVFNDVLFKIHNIASLCLYVINKALI